MKGQLFFLPNTWDGADYSDVKDVPASWAFDAWKVDDLRAQHDGAGVIAAILDTGIDPNHAEFAGGKILKTKDFTGSGSGTFDRNGHGTHCSATVAGKSPKIGVATGAKIIHGKVLGDSGNGGDNGIAAAIDWAVAEGAEVISMSLGSQSPSPTIEAAMIRAANAGAWVIAAAGNEGRQGIGWPGRYDSCIDVAAVDRDFQVAGFSSRGEKIDTSGPGVDIVSAKPGGGYRTMSGTSMATPFIAGLCTCVRGGMKKKGMKIPNVYDFRKILAFRSVDLGSEGDDTDTGPGFMNPLLFTLALEPLPHFEA